MGINAYTREVIKPRAVPQLDNPAEVEEAGSIARTVGGVSGDVAATLQQAQIERNTREETISRARAQTQFNSEIQDEFIRFEQESDLTDPNSAKEFNQMVRQKTAEYLSSHQGSEKSTALLEANLLSLQDKYTTRMNETAVGAQRAFIMDTVGQEANLIAKQVYDTPEAINEAFQQLDVTAMNYGDALNDIDQMEIMDVAKAAIVENSVTSLIDSGQYEKADAIMSNVDYVQTLEPTTQRSLMKQINAAYNSQNKARLAIEQRKEEVELAEQAAGVKMNAESKLRHISGFTGAEMDYESKVNSYAEAMGIDSNSLNVNAKAAIAFPEMYKISMEAQGDPNKEYTPDGKLSVSGIAKQIKTPLTQVQEIQSKYTALDVSVRNFRKDGNKAAILSAITAFKQTFEPNSAVMEGEVRMQGEANSLLGKLETIVKVGQAVSSEQVEDMHAVAADFFNEYKKQKKNQIDPFLKDADERGVRRLDVGMSREAYFDIFGTYDLGQSKSISDYSDEELMQMYNGGMPSQ